MLDSDTKRRIDSCRDILVGKVPDPKSQVEQITIALIYKFMDDMDAQSEELGGKRAFFAGDFAQYGWAKLLSPAVGGFEMLGLYSEAIAKMGENPGVPALFRDIFKNAYLPYRDPETLRAFLKEINVFTYDHSEKLGDAFEYLLSVLGSQGDAGQFRTPRHIIDFIVQVVNPQKGETILDPACGTAGFLISSYKHILAANMRDRPGDLLSADERTRLAAQIVGYDISPDMVRLSLANLYLHGFVEPEVEEYDTLTSDDKWNHYADVILANPPFMSPKGGIKPHKRFSVASNRSEVLFVDYIAEHLTPIGRAGVIVPEGIIFQSGTSYKTLRKLLVDKYLTAVISLPSGIFQPYTGVKTSILIIDRRIAKESSDVLFTEIKNIGFSLGAKRTVLEANDLPNSLADYQAFCSGEGTFSPISFTVPKSKIAANDFILSGQRYRSLAPREGEIPFVALSEFCTIDKGKSSSTKTLPGVYPLILTAEYAGTADHFDFEGDAVCVPLISSTGHGKASVKRIHYGNGKFALADLMAAVVPVDKEVADPRFLFHVLNAAKPALAGLMSGAANVSMKTSDLAAFEVPLPPLAVQQEIVAEIEGYQKVIDGARQVVENYTPRFYVRPEWPMVELEEIFYSIGNGINVTQSDEVGKYKVTRIETISAGIVNLEKTKWTNDEVAPERFMQPGDILLSHINSFDHLGKTAIFPATGTAVIHGINLIRFRPDTTKIIPAYAALTFKQSSFIENAQSYAQRAVNQASIKTSDLRKLTIPLPDLGTQRAIVAEIEEEQRLVEASKQLVGRFEVKIKAVIGRVWGEDKSPAEVVAPASDNDTDQCPSELIDGGSQDLMEKEYAEVY